MIKFINLRGPNGAGKTTLLRCLGKTPGSYLRPVFQPLNQPPEGRRPAAGPAMVKWDKEKAKEGTPKGSPICVTITPEGIALLGDYTPEAKGTTAGCDRISRQDDCKAALEAAARLPEVKLVVFEGIIVSTIFLPWLEWERKNGGMIWAFLDTPLDVCLRRIQERNGGEPIKEELVANKHKTLRDVRRKVRDVYPAGGRVADIRWESAWKDFREIIIGLLQSQMILEEP